MRESSKVSHQVLTVIFTAIGAEEALKLPIPSCPLRKNMRQSYARSPHLKHLRAVTSERPYLSVLINSLSPRLQVRLHNNDNHGEGGTEDQGVPKTGRDRLKFRPRRHQSRSSPREGIPQPKLPVVVAPKREQAAIFCQRRGVVSPRANIDETDTRQPDHLRLEDAVCSRRQRVRRVKAELPVLVRPPAEDLPVRGERHRVVLPAGNGANESEAG